MEVLSECFEKNSEKSLVGSSLGEGTVAQSKIIDKLGSYNVCFFHDVFFLTSPVVFVKFVVMKKRIYLVKWFRA